MFPLAFIIGYRDGTLLSAENNRIWKICLLKSKLD